MLRFKTDCKAVYSIKRGGGEHSTTDFLIIIKQITERYKILIQNKLRIRTKVEIQMSDIIEEIFHFINNINYKLKQ